jgi:hypothetical protein
VAIFGRTTTPESIHDCRIVCKFLREEPLWHLFRSLWTVRRWSKDQATKYLNTEHIEEII